MDEENKNVLLGTLDGGTELMPEPMDSAEDDNVEVALREFNLRQLEAKDMGTMCRIITAIGIKQFKSILSGDTVKDVMDIAKGRKADGEDKTSDIVSEIIGIHAAIDAVGIIMENYPKAENEIISFMASVSGMKVDEVRKLPFADYGQMILEIVMKEDFKDFFRHVRALLRI